MKIAIKAYTVAFYWLTSITGLIIFSLWYHDFIIWYSAKLQTLSIIPSPLLNFIPLVVGVYGVAFVVFFIYRGIAELRPEVEETTPKRKETLTKKEILTIAIMLSATLALSLAAYFIVQYGQVIKLG